MKLNKEKRKMFDIIKNSVFIFFNITLFIIGYMSIYKGINNISSAVIIVAIVFDVLYVGCILIRYKEYKSELTERAYKSHKSSVSNWCEGEPVKSWFEDDCEICVKYESGNTWRYKNLDLPFPSWW